MGYTQGWPGPYIYCVYTVFLAGKSPNIQIYSHIRCIYTVLANPRYTVIYGVQYVGLARTIHSQEFTVYVRYFWQGNLFGHILYVYTILANPTNTALAKPVHVQSRRQAIMLKNFPLNSKVEGEPQLCNTKINRTAREFSPLKNRVDEHFVCRVGHLP